MTPHLSAPKRPWRVLVAHNAYQQRGGEDVVVAAEVALLREAGHTVHLYERHNQEIAGRSRLALLGETMWSGQTTRDMRRLLAELQPDLVHVHNTLPLISPSIYWAAQQAKVPVVQTLHNFRLVCPQAQLRRAGQHCDACVGKVPWRAAVHRCYRDSHVQSVALALTLQVHRQLGTWQHRVALFIALSRFCEQTFADGGLPASRIRLKPNFAADPGLPASTAARPRSGILFVGRLTEEKGVALLAEVWRHRPGQPLTALGSGPAAPLLAGLPGVLAPGAASPPDVAQAMAGAQALVVPSLVPETFGLVVIEAYAAGLPVIASRIGALPELVDDGITGLLVAPGDAADLAAKLAWAHDHPERMAQMGRAARARYESLYTPSANLGQLEAIYAEAIALGHRGVNP